MSLADIRILALQNLEGRNVDESFEHQLGRAVLEALEQFGVDLRQGPTLDEMKSLLADVARTWLRKPKFDHTAA